MYHCRLARQCLSITLLIEQWYCANPVMSLDSRHLRGYTLAMIRSFVHKGLEDFFFDGTRKGIQPKHARKLEEILDRLDNANEIRDMDYPGAYLSRSAPGTARRSLPGCLPGTP